MSDQRVANEILRQLGGNRFIAMTGSKYLTGSSDALSFQIGRFPGVKTTHVRIILNADDTYTVVFMRITKAKRTQLAVENGIYADQLQSCFTRNTGLATRL